MTELKTLKDLKRTSLTINFHDEKGVLISDLRQELGIKYVKELEKEKGAILIENNLTDIPEINLDNGEMIIQNIVYDREDRNKIAQFLRYLFNIKEEDLK